MSTWIGLLRGINVGGNNPLPMKALREHLEALKCRNVRTYIQSGNVVFESASNSASTLAKKIADRIETEHGFRPSVFLLRYEDLASAIQDNPYPNAVDEPKSLHFFFLSEPAINARRAELDAAKSESEDFTLTDKVLYLFAPDGSGRSKLAANAEKYLNVTVTARNYRTVAKLMAMAEQS